jgi:hypothetical protein
MYSPSKNGRFGRGNRTHRRYQKHAKEGTMAATRISVAGRNHPQDLAKRVHAEQWIIGWVKGVGQTFPTITSQDTDALRVDNQGRVETSGFQWVVPKVEMKEFFNDYRQEAVDAGVQPQAFAKISLFTKCYNKVCNEIMNVRVDEFNNVTGSCVECQYWKNLIADAELHGPSGEPDRLAAVAGLTAHHAVIRKGHREGVEKFASFARTPTSLWDGFSMDGIDNCHTSVPWLNRHLDKSHQSLVRVAIKVTGVVEYGSGIHFIGTMPWLHAKSSVSLNFTVIFCVIAQMLERGQKLRRKAFIDLDGGDANWSNYAIVILALLVLIGLYDEIIVHRNPVSHTHNYGDALYSHHSTHVKGTNYRPGHDMRTLEDLLKSFTDAYGKLKGDAKLQSNIMLKATYDFQALAENFKHPDFNLGGVGTHNYVSGTANINPQKMREVHAVRLRKDPTGSKVLLEWLDRQDFNDNKGMHDDAHWQSHNIETDSVLRDGATTQEGLCALRELFTKPSGWRKVDTGGGETSEGWKDLTRSKNSVLNYARSHRVDFANADIEKLEAFYSAAPTTEAAFLQSIEVAGADLGIPSLARVLDYCESADIGGERARETLETRRTEMQINTTGTVSMVRTESFTEHDRASEMRQIRSDAEYGVTEVVSKGDYIFAVVSHDVAAKQNYQLPLSLGRVLSIIPVDVGVIEGSTNHADELYIEWYIPKTKADQKYNGTWVLNAAEVGSFDSYKSTIARGSVVVAGITNDSFAAKVFERGKAWRLLKMDLGMALLRKLEQLPPAEFQKFGIPLPQPRKRRS